uniref:NADH dehydrogenase subunit 6 n=1 Tax=Opimothrips tubulatus TaxID=2724111 RepID=A0A9E9IYM9_9NEOP|nr:NADH dehydrogenase subunit 6 [Opimothrips tubulatus]WAO28731.1 NADH dehydrogenase subunit 6 [Opimothrips tubulatus]
MLIKLIMFFFMMINMSIYMFSSPLMKSFMVILQVPMVSLVIFFFMKSSWFPFLLFISFVGGILILFIYSISMLENETFLSLNNFSILSIFGGGFFICIFFNMILTDYLIINTQFTTSEINNKFIKKLSFLNYFFSKSYYKSSLMLILYLFLAMIAMMKIINSKKKNY